MNQPPRPHPDHSNRSVPDGWDLGGAPDPDDPLGDSRLTPPSPPHPPHATRPGPDGWALGGAPDPDAPLGDSRLPPPSPPGGPSNRRAPRPSSRGPRFRAIDPDAPYLQFRIDAGDQAPDDS